MGFDMRWAETCLQSLDLVTLFQDVLGWMAPSEGCAIATRAFNHPYRAHCIAQRGHARIWEIRLNRPDVLSAKLKARLYQTIHKKHPQPLLIFTDRQRCRSLWYWQRVDSHHSLVFVTQQPFGAWSARLSYLAEYAPAWGRLDLQAQPVDCVEFTSQLRQQLGQLSDSITGIENSCDRRWYAAVLLQRLIIVHILQQRGLLDNNIWYLHNRLGHSQQQQPDIFFQQVLRPLFTQGFALPALERPRSVSWIGQVPYLGDVFYTHPLEQRYTQINITDAPFESILVWFESPLWQRVSNSWLVNTMGLAFEQILTDEDLKNPEAMAGEQGPCCDLVINQFMLRQLSLETGPSAPDFWDILFCGQANHLRQLVQTILPQFSVLDPACGVGTLLVELQHQLVDIYSVIIGQLGHSPHSQLDIWLKGVQTENSSLLQTIYRRIFKHGLYGVDINPAVVDSARLQLLLGLVAIAQHANDVEPLPNLDFNIFKGNSLVGFIRVDEAGFDRLRAAETLLQGNLLQPLAAENYRTILSEKNIALEHYRSRAYLLEELQQGIPHYAQLEFFREQINQLDAQAQAKLNELLLVEFSQTLGIQFRAAQLIKAPRKRLLGIEDIVGLQPFHWGYHFNHVLERTHGFSVIVSRSPQGIFRPTAKEFFQQFCDLTRKKNLDMRTFKTAKRSLLNADPDVAKAWLFYQSQHSLMTDYFYRSPQYEHQGPLLKGQRQRTQLRRHWLFMERCFHLLAPQGICGLLVSNDIKDSPRGMALRSLLETQTENDLHMSLPDTPQGTDRCFLWFYKQ
ncbi:hypothetical protein IQ260_19170 [Leptolyngbya cf. ectocarpi LEGE 11479]|uniref:site-specific DNA-methyltransferase (adenine-specific) n=1 Tax=Leptolyngbya cf. ectocarpi LEGE 11479 TaxID=1828722 RepID=A0A928ZWJ7_LEPEC|nr:hypothetical protein [Leptolyngbya ectocarpi]MBE9068770.1 hypothetical protein [Leptolyngbya cf. ectocarpi LEGE 11479]